MPTISSKLLFAVLLTASSLVHARAGTPDTTYALTLFAGGGFTRNVSHFDVEPDGLQRSGFTGMLRLQWTPEHLLRVGLETGYHYVYGVETPSFTNEFGTTDAKSALAVLPILIVLSMPIIDGLEIWGGAGAGFLSSTVEFFGETTVASSYSPYLYGAVSYMVPIAANWQAGGEVRYVYLDRYLDHNISLQLMVSWKFHTY
jgi:hypothetical protein